MKGQRVGYVRVSTVVQNTDRQLDGVDLDRVFVDKISGKNTDRPELKRMLEFVREDDLVVFIPGTGLVPTSMTSAVVKDLTGKGIKVQFIKENLIFTGEDSPMSNLLLSLLGAVAEFERALIKERQREGIAIAKKSGVYTGRNKTLDSDRAPS